MLLALVTTRRAPVPDEEPALPVGLLALVLAVLMMLVRLGRGTGRRRRADVVVVELVQQTGLGLVGLVVGPVLRVRVAVGAARAVVALPVHAALWNVGDEHRAAVIFRVCWWGGSSVGGRGGLLGESLRETDFSLF